MGNEAINILNELEEGEIVYCKKANEPSIFKEGVFYSPCVSPLYRGKAFKYFHCSKCGGNHIVRNKDGSVMAPK